MGDRSALGWRFRPQFVAGMDHPWEAGIGLGIVLKSLNLGLVPGIPGVSFRLLSVGDRVRVAFARSLPQVGRRQLPAYQG